MRRGEIWTVAGGTGYAGRPRPAVIVQDDRFDTDSLTISPFSTDTTEARLFRLAVQPTASNGLQATSRLMVDKLTTVPRLKVGRQVSVLDDVDLARPNRAIVVFLGMA